MLQGLLSSNQRQSICSKSVVKFILIQNSIVAVSSSVKSVPIFGQPFLETRKFFHLKILFLVNPTNPELVLSFPGIAVQNWSLLVKKFLLPFLSKALNSLKFLTLEGPVKKTPSYPQPTVVCLSHQCPK